MTLEVQNDLASGTGNDSTTVFSFSPMVIFASTDIVVIKEDANGDETTLSEGATSTTYSVGITNYPATGSITYPAVGGTPLATGEKLWIKRVLTIEQQTDLENQGGYSAEVLETQLDKLAMIALQLNEAINRSIRFRRSDTTALPLEIVDIPAAAEFLRVNDAGTGLVWSGAADISAIGLPVSIANGGTAGITAAAALTNLGLSANGKSLVTAANYAAMRTLLNLEAGKNLILNGAMTVAQQGASFTAATTPANNDDTYTLDQWILLSDGNDIVDVAQATNGAVGDYAYLQADVETVQKKFGFAQILMQKDIIPFLGSTGVASLSFNARVADITKLDNIKAVVLSWDGAIDTVTSDVVSAWNAADTTPTWVANLTAENTPANLSVTATDTRYKIENIAIDTANLKNIVLFIWSDAVADNDTLGTVLQITDVQFEEGAIATPFEQEAYSVTLEKCKWHFERLNYNSVSDESVITSYAFDTSTLQGHLAYAEKRKAPTITSTAAGTFAGRSGASAFSAGTSVGPGSNTGVKGCLFQLTGSGAPWTAGQGGEIRRDGTDTCYIDVDARP